MVVAVLWLAFCDSLWMYWWGGAYTGDPQLTAVFGQGLSCKILFDRRWCGHRHLQGERGRTVSSSDFVYIVVFCCGKTEASPQKQEDGG